MNTAQKPQTEIAPAPNAHQERMAKMRDECAAEIQKLDELRTAAADAIRAAAGSLSKTNLSSVVIDSRDLARLRSLLANFPI